MLAVLGSNLIQSFTSLVEFLHLSLSGVLGVFKPPFRIKDIFQQLHFVANESAWIIFVCVSFAAGVVIVEAAFHMRLVVQNASMVPGFAALLIMRELAAVVSCLLLGSRVGAGWTAEVGSMKVTEQIDALKMLGIEPVKYLLSPRLVASILGAAVIVAASNILCIVVAMWVSSLKLGHTSGSFFTAIRSFVDMKDLYFSIIKGLSFGAVIPLISCFFGFRCKAGAEGVGLATTNSVVAISVSIIGLDFILTWIFSYFY
jgi:phospholipid/cholesterol/gamma-HCH transport system permease protein